MKLNNYKILKHKLSLKPLICNFKRFSIFKDLDFPKEYNTLYAFGLSQNYFSNTFAKIKDHLNKFKYDEAINEYNMFIHNVDMYLNTENEFKAFKYLIDNYFKISDIHLKNRSIDQAIDTLDNIKTCVFKGLNNTQLISDVNTKNYIKLVYSKLYKQLKEIYKLQIDYLLFTSKEAYKIQQLFINEEFNYYFDSLIEYRNNKLKTFKSYKDTDYNTNEKEYVKLVQTEINKYIDIRLLRKILRAVSLLQIEDLKKLPDNIYNIYTETKKNLIDNKVNLKYLEENDVLLEYNILDALYNFNHKQIIDYLKCIIKDINNRNFKNEPDENDSDHLLCFLKLTRIYLNYCLSYSDKQLLDKLYLIQVIESIFKVFSIKNISDNAKIENLSKRNNTFLHNTAYYKTINYDRYQINLLIIKLNDKFDILKDVVNNEEKLKIIKDRLNIFNSHYAFYENLQKNAII